MANSIYLGTNHVDSATINASDCTNNAGYQNYSLRIKFKPDVIFVADRSTAANISNCTTPGTIFTQIDITTKSENLNGATIPDVNIHLGCGPALQNTEEDVNGPFQLNFCELPLNFNFPEPELAINYAIEPTNDPNMAIRKIKHINYQNNQLKGTIFKIISKIKKFFQSFFS